MYGIPVDNPEEKETIPDPYAKDVDHARLVEGHVNYFKGPEHLKSVLSKPKKSQTFVKAVRKFKEDNEIEVSSLGSALNILDMHKVPRAAFSSQAAADLLAMVHHRLQNLGEMAIMDPKALDKLEKFVPKIFPLHQQKEYRPLVIEILAHLPVVQHEYIDTIADNQEFYQECPISVLRHVWLRHPRLFFEYIKPIMRKYHQARNREITNIEISKMNFFTSTPAKERRKCPEVKKLLEIVGTEFKLYKKLLHWIRISYSETGHHHLCTLRAELIMASHDAGNERFTKLDMAYEFARCLDTCMRDKNLDNNHSQKLKTILDLITPLHYIIGLDIAMVCADPHVMHFLSGLIVRKIRDNCANLLIREMPAVVLGMRILNLGLSAQTIAQSRAMPEKLFDSTIITQYLSALAGCILEDHMFVEGLTDPETNEPIRQTLIPSLVVKFIKADRLAALIYLHYVLDLLPMKGRTFNKQCLDRYALNLPLLNGNIAVEGLWGYLFIDRLLVIHLWCPFVSEDTFWKRHLMEELLIPSLNYARDPIVKFNHFRIIMSMGYCWGTNECMESFTKYHQLPLDVDFLKAKNSFYADQYILAHNRMVAFLWDKKVMKPPMETGVCKNGHVGCEYHCPHAFLYGKGEEFFHRVEECYPGFDNPPYLMERDGRYYLSEDNSEDYFDLVNPVASPLSL